MKNSALFGAIRILTAIAIIVGVSWQIIDRLIHNVFRPTEYFAFFTILTSMFTAVVLVWCGISLFANGTDSERITKLRLSATTAYVIVSVVYNALLRNDHSSAPQDAAVNYHWPTPPNEILHVWAPLVVLLEFLIARFGPRLNLRQFWNVLTFPLVWLALTIVKGIATNWWPYWFLDPTDKGGVIGMVEYAAAISAFFILVGWGLALAHQRSTNLANQDLDFHQPPIPEPNPAPLANRLGA